MYGIEAKTAAEQRIQTFPRARKDLRTARFLIRAITSQTCFWKCVPSGVM